MKQDMAFEDYADYRKAYVKKVRREFDADRFTDREDTGEDEAYFSFVKLRLVAAMLLFIGFLYCWYTDTPILGHSAQAIIDMVEDDKYYEAFKDYIVVEDEAGNSLAK